MKIFVTGGTGFIGSHFINAAHLEGKIVVAQRRTTGGPTAFPLILEPHWLDKPMDQVTYEDFDGCETLVHLAAAGVDLKADWKVCFEVNVQQSLCLWITAINAGVKRLVICGSCFEYGKSGERYNCVPVNANLEPTGAYHSSKAAATMAALGFAVEKNIELIVVRPFHVYGEGEASHRFWPSLRRAAFAGEDFKMTSGKQVRDFIPVSDVAKSLLLACNSKELQRGVPVIKNIGSGRPKSLAEFASEMWSQFKASGNLIVGAVPDRLNEVYRFVPELDE